MYVIMIINIRILFESNAIYLINDNKVTKAQNHILHFY